MNTYVICLTTGGSHEFEVHRVGCPDLGHKHYNNTWHSARHDTAAMAVAEEVADLQSQDQGYTADDFKILPCALTPKHVDGKVGSPSPNSPILEDGRKASTTMTTKTAIVCGCGCGEHVTRRFKPGHDARLKGEMLRQFRAGTAKDKAAAIKIAAEHGWERFLTDAPAKPTKPAKTRQHKGFSAVRVKVGRWVYDAILLESADDHIVVEYKGPKGNLVQATLKPSAIQAS